MSGVNWPLASPFANCLLRVPFVQLSLAFPSYFRSLRDRGLRPLFGFAPKQTKGSSAWRTIYIVLHEGCLESSECETQTTSWLFTCPFCDGYLILIRSFVSREASSFQTSFWKWDITLITLILTDTNAKNLFFFYHYSFIDWLFKQEREREESK